MSKFSGLEGNNLPKKVGVRLKVTLPLWIFSEIYVLIELTCGEFEKYILFYQGFRPKP